AAGLCGGGGQGSALILRVPELPARQHFPVRLRAASAPSASPPAGPPSPAGQHFPVRPRAAPARCPPVVVRRSFLAAPSSVRTALRPFGSRVYPIGDGDQVVPPSEVSQISCSDVLAGTATPWVSDVLPTELNPPDG